MTHVKREWKEKTIMSKTGAWALDHEEKRLPTFTVVQASSILSTWIIQCQDEETALKIAETSEPDNEEVTCAYDLEVTDAN